MFLRQGVSLSVVVLAGALISACVSSPTKTGLSEFGRYQCGQLEVTVTSSGDDELVGLEYLNRRVLLKPAESASGALFVAPGDPVLEQGGAGNAEPAWRDASRVPGAGRH